MYIGPNWRVSDSPRKNEDKKPLKIRNKKKDFFFFKFQRTFFLYKNNPHTPLFTKRKLKIRLAMIPSLLSLSGMIRNCLYYTTSIFYLYILHENPIIILRWRITLPKYIIHKYILRLSDISPQMRMKIPVNRKSRNMKQTNSYPASIENKNENNVIHAMIYLCT